MNGSLFLAFAYFSLFRTVCLFLIFEDNELTNGIW